MSRGRVYSNYAMAQKRTIENKLLSKITKKDSVREKKSRGLLKKIKNTWGLPQVFFCAVYAPFSFRQTIADLHVNVDRKGA